MRALRLLQAAMMLQIGLGLWRFTALYLGLPVELRVWRAHPILGIGIALAALALFRPGAAVMPTRIWTAARYVAFAPLLLGLSLRYGAITGLAAVVSHMLIGVTALGLMDAAIKRELAQRTRNPAVHETSPRLTGTSE